MTRSGIVVTAHPLVAVIQFRRQVINPLGEFLDGLDEHGDESPVTDTLWGAVVTICGEQRHDPCNLVHHRPDLVGACRGGPVLVVVQVGVYL